MYLHIPYKNNVNYLTKFDVVLNSWEIDKIITYIAFENTVIDFSNFFHIFFVIQ